MGRWVGNSFWPRGRRRGEKEVTFLQLGEGEEGNFLRMEEVDSASEEGRPRGDRSAGMVLGGI